MPSDLKPKIEEIRKRCEAATPQAGCSVCKGTGTFMDYYPLGDEECLCGCGAADFYSKARQDLPWALDELEKRDRALERAEESLRLIIDPSLASDFVQSLGPQFLAAECLRQITAILSSSESGEK